MSIVKPRRQSSNNQIRKDSTLRSPLHKNDIPYPTPNLSDLNILNPGSPPELIAVFICPFQLLTIDPE